MNIPVRTYNGIYCTRLIFDKVIRILTDRFSSSLAPRREEEDAKRPKPKSRLVDTVERERRLAHPEPAHHGQRGRHGRRRPQAVRCPGVTEQRAQVTSGHSM